MGHQSAHVFTMEPVNDAKTPIDWIHRSLKEERDIVILSPPVAATAFHVENIRMDYVLHESEPRVAFPEGRDRNAPKHVFLQDK
jgi:hypothetical protein